MMTIEDYLTRKRLKLILYVLLFLIISAIIFAVLELTITEELDLAFDKSELYRILLFTAGGAILFYFSVDWISEKILRHKK
jgi:hypothetical protein